MAPTRPAKNFKAGQSHRSSSPSDDEDFEDGVIEESALDPVKIAQDMLKSSRKRREAKHKAIESEYADRIKKCRTKIDALFGERRTKVTKLQNQKWDELQALLKKRRDIEGRIIKSMKIIEQTAMNLTHELSAAYTGRLEDIAELDTTGKLPRPK